MSYIKAGLKSLIFACLISAPIGAVTTKQSGSKIRDEKAPLAERLNKQFIRLRSTSTGKYLATRWNGKTWVLRAESDNPYEPAVNFRITFISIKQVSYIGIYSPVAGKNLQGAASGSVSFSRPNFAKDTDTNEHWELVGNDLNEAVQLQNQATQSFLYLVKGEAKVGGKAENLAIELATNDVPFKKATKINGALDQMSVGNPLNIWGVSNNQAYYLSQNQWTLTPGQCKSVSVGADGTVIAVAPDNTLLRWKNNTWISMPGSFEQVAVGNKSNIWAVLAGNAYQWNGNTWVQDSAAGKIKQISVGADGSVWVVHPDNKVAYKQGTKWVNVGGILLQQIAVGHANNIWGISPDNNVYWWTGISFMPVPAAKFWVWNGGQFNKPVIKQIAAGSGASQFGISVYALSTNNEIFKLETPDWIFAGMPNIPLSKLAIGNENYIYGIGTNRKIYHYNNTTKRWELHTTQLPNVTLNHLAVGRDGTIYASDGGKIYQVGGGAVGGNTRSIAVANNSHIWHVEPDGDIYFKPGSGAWQKIPGKMLSIAAAISDAGEQTVWGVGLNKAVYSWNGTTWNKTKVEFGCPFEISIENSNNIWFLGEAGEIIKYNTITGTQCLGDSIKSLSAGEDGTIWGLTHAGSIVKLQLGPTERAQAAKLIADEQTIITTENTLDQIKRLPFKEQLAKYDDLLMGRILFTTETANTFMWNLNSLVAERKADQLADLRKLISTFQAKVSAFTTLIDTLLNATPPGDPTTITRISKEELKSLNDKLQKKFDECAASLSPAEILSQAKALFSRLIANASSPEFAQNTDKLLDKLEYLVTNIDQASQEEFRKLVLSIKEQISKIPPTPFASKLTAHQGQRIQKIIDSLATVSVAAPTGPAAVAITAPEKLDYKTVLTRAKANILKAINSDTDADIAFQDAWLNDIDFLVKKENLEQISADDIQSYKDLLATIADYINASYFVFPPATASAKSKQLNNLLATGKKYFLYIAMALQGDKLMRGLAIQSTLVDSKAWGARVKYLASDLDGRTVEELNAIKGLVKQIDKYSKILPAPISADIKDALSKMKLATASPFQQLTYQAAQASSLVDVSGTPGTITLYGKAIESITKDTTADEILDFINSQLTPVVQAVLADDVLKNDTKTLAAIQTLFTNVIAKSPKDNKPILDAINAATTPITQQLSVINVTAAFDTLAKAQGSTTDKLTLFKQAINLIPTTLSFEISKNLLDSITSFVNAAIADTTLTKDNFTAIQTLLTTAQTNMLAPLTDSEQQGTIKATFGDLLKKVSDIISATPQPSPAPQASPAQVQPAVEGTLTQAAPAQVAPDQVPPAKVAPSPAPTPPASRSTGRRLPSVRPRTVR